MTQKKVKKTTKSVLGDFCDTFLTLRAGRPGNTFLRLFGDFGARGCGDSLLYMGIAIATQEYHAVEFPVTITENKGGNLGPAASSRPPPETALARFGVRLMSATSVRRVCDDIREFARSYLYAILCLLSMLSLSLLVSVSLCVLGIPRAG